MERVSTESMHHHNYNWLSATVILKVGARVCGFRNLALISLFNLFIGSA